MKLIILIFTVQLSLGLETTPSKSQTLLEGSPLILSCSGPKGQAIQWTYNKKRLTPNGSMSIRGSPHSIDIEFTAISVDHKGNYTCLTHTHTNSTHNKTLEVKVIPRADFSKMPIQHLVKEGHHANLTCPVYSSPQPSHIYWTFNQKIIQNSNKHRINHENQSIIEIRNVTKNDIGPYTCNILHLSHDASITQSKTTRLNTLTKPILTTNNNWSKDPVMKFDNKSLPCAVIARPPAYFNWYLKTGKSITKIQNTSSTLLENSHNNSTLHLYAISQFGEYLCRPSNNLGLTGRLFQVHEGKPISIVHFQKSILHPTRDTSNNSPRVVIDKRCHLLTLFFFLRYTLSKMC